MPPTTWPRNFSTISAIRSCSTSASPTRIASSTRTAPSTAFGRNPATSGCPGVRLGLVAVQNLVDKMRDLSAMEVHGRRHAGHHRTDSGIGSWVSVLAKVRISTLGTGAGTAAIAGFVGSRDGDVPLYQLDPTAPPRAPTSPRGSFQHRIRSLSSRAAGSSVNPSPTALQTDFYQLTMAAPWLLEAGKTNERATFELYVRRLPSNRKFILAAGLAQAIDYLLNLRFSTEEIEYLRGLPQFRRTRPEFFDMLTRCASPAMFLPPPKARRCSRASLLLTVRAPLIEAQLGGNLICCRASDSRP